jgi:signal transduction histidine kinase
VQVSEGPELPLIFGDSDQLQQVFLNLLLNARDAMPDGGQLDITIAANDGGVTVSVCDTGPGIDDAVSKKAFDPFFTTKPAGQGTGLGLAVCYGIVTAHGGTIDVSSNAAGGACFFITLPATLDANLKRRIEA